MRFSVLRVQCLPRARPGGAPCLKYALTFTVFVAVAAAGLVAADWVSAHGSGFQLTKRAQAGPYELLLGTIPDPPIVGEAILILQVADPDTGVRVPNVVVTAAPVGTGWPGRPPHIRPGLVRPDTVRGARCPGDRGPLGADDHCVR